MQDRSVVNVFKFGRLDNIKDK